MQAFLMQMETQGWRCRVQEGWIHLDASVPAPTCEIPANLAGACGCCISILQRHSAENGPAEDLIRRLAKAADAGPMVFAKECEWLHGELAQMLRLHQLVPGALLPYLCCGAAMCSQ